MKKVIITIFASLTVFSLVMSFFLSNILGAFGMVTTSLATLQKLKSSEAVVQQLKKRHHTKKAKVTKKLAKRAGKKVTSATVAAATLGPIAVATVVTGLEIKNYCDDKRDLQEEANLLFGTNIEFDYKNCADEARKDSIEIYDDLKQSSVDAVASAFKKTTDYSSTVWSTTLETSKEGLDTAKSASISLYDKTITLLHRDEAEEVEETEAAHTD